jgi:NDP-sugar pyrophosphorylase family protein
MILAAGRGERFLPLTRTLAKPAIPVLGRPLAIQIATRLSAAGAERIVVNLHHLPSSMKEVLADADEEARPKIRTTEETTLLGTGGGLRNAAPLLRGGGPILVHNADALSDVPLEDVVQAHVDSGLEATLVLAPGRPGYTGIAVADDGRIVAIGGPGNPDGPRPFLFTGIHVVDEALLDRIPADGPSDIVRDVYMGAMRSGTLGSWIHEGFWWEFGTPSSYLEGSLRLVRMDPDDRRRIARTDPVRPFGEGAAAIGPGADFHAGGIVLRGSVVLGMASLLGEGVEIEDSVILDGAWVGPGCRLRRVVVGPGTEVPAGLDLESLLVCPDGEPDAPPPPACERFGGLMARRLD